MRFLRLVKFDLVESILKKPGLDFSLFVMPVVLLYILGSITEGNYTGGFSSYGYYAIGLIIYFQLSTGMTAANTFMEEKVKKPNLRLIYAPINKYQIVLSKIVSTYIASLISLLESMILFKLLFKVEFGERPEIVFLMFSSLALLSITLAVLVCIIVKDEGTTNMLFNIIITLFALLGGVLFQVDNLGKIVSKISDFCPVKWIMNSVFRMIYDGNYNNVLPILLGITFISIVIAGICKVTFKTEDFV